jgi:hypothetical protein
VSTRSTPHESLSSHIATNHLYEALLDSLKSKQFKGQHYCTKCDARKGKSVNFFGLTFLHLDWCNFACGVLAWVSMKP